MKDSPKIPLWAVYAADALMFAAVFAVALPNIITATPLSAGAVFWCSIMVLGGLLASLVPYYLDNAGGGAKKRAERDAKVDSDLGIIFDELAALRMMIADAEERGESYPARLEALESASEKLSAASSRGVSKEELSALVAEIREAVKKKIGEVENCVADISAKSERTAQEQRDTDKIVAELCSDITILKDLLPASNESITDELCALKEKIDAVSNAASAPADDAEIIPDEPADGEDDELFENPAEHPSGMLGRALAASENSRGSVDKFISLGRPQESAPAQTDAAEVSEKSGEDSPAEPTLDSVREQFDKIADDILLGKSEDASSEPAETQPAAADAAQAQNVSAAAESAAAPDVAATPEVSPAPDASANADAERVSETPARADSSDSLPPPPDYGDNSGDEHFFDFADSPWGLDESKTAESGDTLFELPELISKAQKPKKGDACITVNAMVGIGNKPYLRGFGGGLSPDKGVPMEFVEIGKWRYVFPDAQSPIEFTVLNNDINPSSSGEYFKVLPAEKLELNLTFPF